MNQKRLNIGDVVKHFKREMLDSGDLAKNPKKYLYRILAFATHTETGETMVIYQALYESEDNIYARPYDMFMGEVDHNKYPNIRQKYRFEDVNDYENIELTDLAN